eukprot:1149923-Pelagomonas_calceolata.AAC.11
MDLSLEYAAVNLLKAGLHAAAPGQHAHGNGSVGNRPAFNAAAPGCPSCGSTSDGTIHRCRKARSHCNGKDCPEKTLLLGPNLHCQILHT